MLRRCLTPVLALAAAAVAAPAAVAAGLEPGGTAFWSGAGPGGSCGERCWEQTLDVAPGASVLRVAVDQHTVGSEWRLELTDPGGGPGGSATVRPGLYSAEAAVDDPVAGRWVARVSAAAGVADLRFRGRAKLERAPVLPDPPVPELPNLQALPPWDFSFMFPVTNGTSDPPVGIPLPGGRAACHPEEVAEGALRCLRMAFGVSNTGRGPMDLFVGPGAETADRELVQRVHRSDGSSFDRPAGRARFHTSHGHYHHDGAIGLELLRVADPGGRLEPAAERRLKGFAHRNELLRDWRHFYPRLRMEGFGLLAGWGDYYEWDRPGNYVDFGLNGDGRYVLRLTADPVGGVLESNEADNVAYSLVEVRGADVSHLQSGRGTDPWDPCRIVLPLGPEPDPPPGDVQPVRPAQCPADTVDPDPAPAVAPPRAPAPPASRPAARRRGSKGGRRCAKRRAAKGRGSKRSRRAARACRRAAARRRAGRR